MIHSIGQMPSDIQNILSNIKQLRENFEGQNSIPSKIDTTGNDEIVSFKETLTNAIQGINKDHQVSKDLKNSFELGDPRVSLEQVTIASQKASIGFEAMVQVRNKLVDAYKEIMSMPI